MAIFLRGEIELVLPWPGFHVKLPFAKLFLTVLYQLGPDLIKTQTVATSDY